MAKNWRNSEFVAKFLTKFALSDERKMAFWRQNPLEPSNNDANFQVTLDVSMVIIMIIVMTAS